MPIVIKCTDTHRIKKMRAKCNPYYFREFENAARTKFKGGDLAHATEYYSLSDVREILAVLETYKNLTVSIEKI